MNARTLTLSAEAQQLKAATRAMVKAFGGQEAVALASGYRQQRISDLGLGKGEECAPIGMIDRSEGSTVGLPGWPHMTRLLARRRGFALVALPEEGADPARGDAGLMVALAHISAELGDLSRVLTEAQADDGEVDGREAALALDEVGALIERACALKAALARICAPDPAQALRVAR